MPGELLIAVKAMPAVDVGVANVYGVVPPVGIALKIRLVPAGALAGLTEAETDRGVVALVLVRVTAMEKFPLAPVASVTVPVMLTV